MAGIIKGIKTILGDVEMAPYTVVADHEIYEERLYPAKKWACTSAESIERESVVSSMFRILFNYISGKNKPNIRIDMTTPVTTYVEPGSSATCPSKFTMGFFIPEDHQDDPPEPADSTVFLKSRPEMSVLTRRFGGFANESDIVREAKELAEILKSAGEQDVNFEQYYIVGYDPPYKPINRRNEIWYIKKTLPSTETKTEPPTTESSE